IQEFFITAAGKRNVLQLRADIFNVGNLINSDWGVSNRVVQASPLVSAGTTAGGVPQYRINSVGAGAAARPISTTFIPNNNIGDVWTGQVGVRYIFN
ncbi:MAG: hypothetical protein H7Y04_01940, partial [Verrucomicrobia bacterium]|nr:hypothetical protein [Cytophagales bacterium]